jgi:hypothetical protein
VSSSSTTEVTRARRKVVLRPPGRVYFVGAGLGLLGALAPYVVPGLVTPWEATRATLVASALAALGAHAALHAFTRDAGPWRRVAAGKLAPGLTVALAALAVYVLAQELRALAYAAFVVNAAASAVDAWEATELARLRPSNVRDLGGRLECEIG